MHNLTKGYFDLNDISYIYFETDGSISVLPKGKEKPTVVSDFQDINIEKLTPSMYPIVDGKINKDVLGQMNKDENWLYKKCNLNSKKDLKNIILADSQCVFVSFRA